MFNSRLTSWGGKAEIAAGYLFTSLADAEASAREVAALGAEGGPVTVGQGVLFADA